MPTSQNCPAPTNEAQRLDAVRSYEILDTQPELEFDALARVASHAFAAPISVVAMMDADRLWFKSKIGLDIPQLDRQIAFCAHTIMHPSEPMVISNLLEDQRFAFNPLVANAPNLRFYAGCPIVDPNGLALGTIAVIDAKPRVFFEEQRAALADMSALVVTALLSRRRLMDLQKLALTDHLTGIGNRAQFDKAMASEMKYVQRTGSAFSLLCIDLNGFKAVNDTFGHQAGDEVLTEISRRLQLSLREGDSLMRLGGDEFAVVMRHGDGASAATLAQRIVSSASLPISLASGQTVVLGLSIGITDCTGLDTSQSAVLARADKALYEAKNRPREWPVVVASSPHQHL